jgi:hypothetical protein
MAMVTIVRIGNWGVPFVVRYVMFHPFRPFSVHNYYIMLILTETSN